MIKLGCMAFSAGAWWRFLGSTEVETQAQALQWANDQLREWHTHCTELASAGGVFELTDNMHELIDGIPRVTSLHYGIQIEANGGEEIFVVALDEASQAAIYAEFHKARIAG